MRVLIESGETGVYRLSRAGSFLRNPGWFSWTTWGGLGSKILSFRQAFQITYERSGFVITVGTPAERRQLMALVSRTRNVLSLDDGNLQCSYFSSN